MPTLVDTDVLIDIVHPDAMWEQWSAGRLLEARREGPVVINPIIQAEMAVGFDLEGELEATLPGTRFLREELPWQAAFLAGRAFASCRRSSGGKRSPLPDFYIGAHALVRDYALLTRDRARYASCVPMLRIVSPETHP